MIRLSALRGVGLALVVFTGVGCSSEPEYQPRPAATKPPPSAPRKAQPSRASQNPTPDTAPAKPALADTVVRNACGLGSYRGELSVIAKSAPIYIYPQVLAVPLVRQPIGAKITARATVEDWYEVQFPDTQWGPRIGFIHCSQVLADIPPVAAPSSSPGDRTTTPQEVEALPSPPSGYQPVVPVGKPSKPWGPGKSLGGYVEWLQPNQLIADGQRVQWDSRTQFKLGKLRSIGEVPLGYELTARGHRTEDGAILASEIQVKPNATAAFETDVLRLANAAESNSVRAGFIDLGHSLEGRIIESGPDVERVRRIVTRVLPPYIDRSRIRVRVVNIKDWNAAAMSNGSIWVFKGLLDDLSDDELACVLGHEVAHFTHEHSRRNTRNLALVRIAGRLASEVIGSIDNATGAATATIGAWFGLNAWGNGYSRTLEDQADRVGLRYAYEAGFDVRVAPGLWKRVRAKEGELSRVANFLGEDHSRPTERIRNVETQIRLNYQQPVPRR